MQIIPFLPLNQSAIENILRIKLKQLGKVLDTRYGIELGYAPEVIRYLSHDILTRQKFEPLLLDISNTLKKLYFAVEQAILHQADNKNRPNQLFLQLNETGQVIRCHWLATMPLRHHTP